VWFRSEQKYCVSKPKKKRGVDEETEKAEIATIKHYNLNSLIYKSTRKLYQQRLDEKLLNNEAETGGRVSPKHSKRQSRGDQF